LLLKCRLNSYRIGLCTNLAKPYGAAVHALLPGLDAYVFSYEAGFKKPEPEIYRASCDALICRPEEVLFIGDNHDADVEGPGAFGMQAQLINRKGGQTLKDLLKKELK